jgi:glycosyltransferase involved in cell wall biosynthesis
MNRKPLVSVVINFLNAGQFLQEAIESVLAQTYDNWELLLVDDGSTDTSTEIALKYIQEHPGKVHFLEHDGHQNRGVSASRNLGISNANGEYIAFLDADDIWLPDKLEQQTAILESRPEAAMIYGPQRVWYSWTGRPEDIQRDYVPELGVQLNTLIEPPKLLTLFLQKEGAGVVPSPSGILVRRAVIEHVGGSEETFRNVFDDMVLYAKLGLEAPVFVSDRCWYWYRQHPNQRCYVTNKTGQYHSARLAYLKWLQEYLTKRGGRDGEVWPVLQKELWPYRHPTLQRLLMQMMRLATWIARRILPASVRKGLGLQWLNRQYIPPMGHVRFGNLRRVRPISRLFGSDRGRCIDRYYIENFLTKNTQDIRGNVLEIGDASYTRKFGRERVTNSAVLHVTPSNPQATLIGDLATGAGIPASAFDCMILTQTFPFIYDVKGAIANAYAALKPGGVLLATFPGISQISRYDMDRWGEFWRFTTLSARRLFEEIFPAENVTIEAKGNVLAAIAFLHGLAAEELRQEELDYHDPNYEVSITVRAVKS